MNFGTDIASHGKLSSNGQIALVSDRDNLIQACRNRIRTYKGTYSVIDSDYGTNIKEIIGYDDTGDMRQIICLDIETALVQDIRIAIAECEYVDGKYIVKVTTIDGDEILIDDVII